MIPGKSPKSHGSRPEISCSSIVLGIIIGAILNAAITYAGLKIGFTIVGSAIVAVLGFGVLRGVLRRGSILEVNIAQTLGTAVNASNAGIIFTVPVLLLLGEHLTFDNPQFWWLTLAATAGALLGVVFIVPMRSQMIDIERLRFPSGTAVAAILRSPGSGSAKTLVLLAGVVIGAGIYLPAAIPSVKVQPDPSDLDRLVAAGRLSEGDAARARIIESIRAGQSPPTAIVAQGQASLDGNSGRAHGPMSVDERFGRQVYAVTRGDAGAESLQPFWPRVPLRGYSALGWRVAEERDEQGALSERSDRNRDGHADLILTDTDVDVGRALGIRADILLVLAITPLSFGAGFLTGRNGLVVLAGGLLAAVLLNPISNAIGLFPQSLQPHQVGSFALAAVNRPLGIGMLLGGAAMGVLFAIPALREVVRGMLTKSAGIARDDLGLRPIVGIAALGMAVLLLAVELGAPGSTDLQRFAGVLSGVNPALAKAITVIIIAVWIWFAGVIIAQCTGMTDWSPISGLALLTVVFVMLLGGTGNLMAAIMLGVALCAAISLASDMMHDLKTGHLVGSSPRRQQIVELLGAAFGPVITMSTLVLITRVNVQAFGVPLGAGTDTPAPQAETLRAVVLGMQGGDMPYALYGFGTAIGALLGLGAFPGLGVLIGLSMFLPTRFVTVYGLGCLANMLLSRMKGRRWTEDWGVPFCAGLIVGEAMLALAVNSIVLVRG